jgi:hypothetical protein
MITEANVAADSGFRSLQTTKKVWFNALSDHGAVLAMRPEAPTAQRRSGAGALAGERAERLGLLT